MLSAVPSASADSAAGPFPEVSGPAESATQSPAFPSGSLRVPTPSLSRRWGGRLQWFADTWELICPDKWVVDVISKGYLLEFTSPPPLTGGGKATPVPPDPVQRAALEEELRDLLLKKAVTRTTGLEGPLFRSSFFLAPKKNNSWRPILNLRPLNVACLRPQHFRMENLKVILPFLRKGMWAATLDLKDAYLHIPIAPAHQRFLAFEYQGITYKFTSLPFGLSTSPRVFTRVAGAVVAELRRRGIMLFAYIDDWLIVGRTESLCRNNVSDTITLLHSLGWVINWEKSCPTPTQSLIYLGANIDLTKGRVFPSEERLRSLREAVSVVESTAFCTASSWLRMLGLMASMIDVLPLCRLRMRPLQFHLLSVFRPADRDLRVSVPLSVGIRPHLEWWKADVNLREGIPFGIWRPQLTVTTDASLSGWGAFCQARTLSGVWTQEEALLHINVLELEAVVRAVKALTDLAKGSCLTVFSDNTTTVAYINRQGGTRSPNLCLKAWFLLLWCRKYDIQLRASHIAGKDNTLADALSRGRVSQGEWELAPRWADWLFQRLGRPLVDLFATAENAKLPTFCSRGFHP